jgi:uncharacterized phage protein gp47/JayE
MARPTFTTDEANIKNRLIDNIKDRFGNVSENRDSAVMAFSESIADELSTIRRENNLKFEQLQMSNASGEFLDNAAMNTYGLSRRPASKSLASSSESNIYFYIEEGVFGDINGGEDIIIPAGTKLFVKPNSYGENITYEITQDYILDNDLNRTYCSAISTDTGYDQNIEKASLNFHDFNDYEASSRGLLKVTNRFPIINGSDIESDQMLRSRVSNYLTARSNLNEDWIVLRSIMVPGIVDIKMIPNYFGIGTLGLIVYGAGKQNTESIINMVKGRVREVASPGLSIEVVQGITVYLDFDIRVYIKQGLNAEEKSSITASVKEYVYREIERSERAGSIDFVNISNYIKSVISSEIILGFGAVSNGSIFEKVYERKSDRYEAFPEYREEIVNNTLHIEDDEKFGFGIVNIVLEEGDL